MKRNRLVKIALVGLVSLGASGCVVPESRYDRAVDRMQAEQSAHRATADKLARVEQQLAHAEGLLEQSHASIEQREEQLARAELNIDQVATERDDASRMVEQLRGELGRAGDHLHAFSEQKDQLESALEAAENRAEQLENAERDLSLKILMMRDLTFALAGDVQEDRAAIFALSGNPVVRVPAAAFFDGQATALRDDAPQILHRIAAALAPYERSRLEITEVVSDVPAKPEVLVVRLQSIADQLSAGGIGFERVTLALPADTVEPAAARSEGEAGGQPRDPASTVDDDRAGESRSAPAADRASDAEARSPAPGWRRGPASVQFTVSLPPRES